MNCHYCQGHIPWSDRGDTDDCGNQYHFECGQHLRTKFDGRRQEEMVEEVSILQIGPDIFKPKDDDE